MVAKNSKASASMIAPWWRSLQQASANKKITKAEVKKLIEPFKDIFERPGTYRDELSKILAGKSKVKMTAAAHAELAPKFYGLGRK